ncbi:aminoglycoside phosphotransferase family protein [Actinoplanes sp. NPDC051346]|uniref:phosphotransferase enzyme family protein n=1 Tax=Actinoplanes sp. NPDC051346 TaxID=3155048 RepID=UPI00343B0B3C
MSTTLTAEAADHLARGLASIRQHTGLTSGDAELMRYTINAVYRIGDRVLRLSHGAAARRRADRVVLGAALLHRHGVPIVQLAADIDQPVVVGDWVATVWHYLPHPPGRPAAAELAGPLARLHAITDVPAALPRWSPIGTARRRLATIEALPGTELDFTRAWAQRELQLPLDDLTAALLARCDKLDARIAEARWELPVGLIHGDAHVGNLLAGRLCDFDSLAVGPREWDLVPLAHSAARFGDAVQPYQQFAAAYGYDLTTSQSWPLLRDVRDLQLVTSVLDKLTGRPEVAQTLGHRLRTYLSGDRNAVWTRYR